SSIQTKCGGRRPSASSFAPPARGRPIFPVRQFRRARTDRAPSVPAAQTPSAPPERGRSGQGEAAEVLSPIASRNERRKAQREKCFSAYWTCRIDASFHAAS